MATPSDLSEEGDAEEVLEKELCKLRLAKEDLFEKWRPISEELERIAYCERECVDKLHCLRAEINDGEKQVRQQRESNLVSQKQTVERLIEVESELKRAKSENVRLSDTIGKLNGSLDEATKYSTAQKLRIAELESSVRVAEQELDLATAAVQARSKHDISTVSELQKQLHETRKLLNATAEELRGTRQRLSEVQEQLTVAEQVTAATQQRALQESGNSDELQLEQTPQHQSTTDLGDVLIPQYISFNKIQELTMVSSYESTVKQPGIYR